MEKVLIGIEREKFLYLYKYNSCFISISSIVEIDNWELFSEKAKKGNDSLAKSLEEALPFFENEDEVVFMVYEKKYISFNNRVSLVFQGVQNLIPLNEIAYNIIKSKINQNFRLSAPLPQALFEKIYLSKQEKIRTISVSKIRSLFNISKLKDEAASKDFFALLKGNINRILLKNPYYESSSAFSQLLRYDTTPNFAPEGNVESFIKLGCIALKAVNSDESILTQGPYYHICNTNKSHLNQLSLKGSYEKLKDLLKRESKENKPKIEKLQEILGRDFPKLNSFLIYYLFLSFNRILSEADFNLLLLKKDIEELKKYYPEELAYAMVIFAYVHSYERLYESFHRLSNAPLFKTSKLIPSPKKTTYIVNKPKTNPSNVRVDIKKNAEKEIEKEIIINKDSTRYRESNLPKSKESKQNPEPTKEKEDRDSNEKGIDKGEKEIIRDKNTTKVIESNYSKDKKTNQIDLFDQKTDSKISVDNAPKLPQDYSLEITNENSLSESDLRKITKDLVHGSDKKYLAEIKKMLKNKVKVTKDKVNMVFKNKNFRKVDGELNAGANRVYNQIMKILN